MLNIWFPLEEFVSAGNAAILKSSLLPAQAAAAIL
jgi:hypothetical protein